MKKVVLLLMVIGCLSCKNNTPVDPYIPAPVGSYAKGADLSWLTEQEDDGVLFYDSLGQTCECMRLMRDHGMNSVRLRVWVNHSTGWCNLPDVIVKAKRAAELKLRIMIDFHYSDFFADPGRQDIPADWQDYDITQMKQAVTNHTTEVLTALKNEGITPEWIQVGNETRNGMLWPLAQLWDENGDTPNGWKNYATLTTAGYNACKAIFPEASVIVHIDNAYLNNNWFFRKLKYYGGKWDMIGLSHYPMMKQWSGKDWEEMNELAVANIKLLHGEFDCPVMVVEIGTLSYQETQATAVIDDFRQRVDTLDYMKGIFYWEPQVYNSWRPAEYITLGWGAYNMGAFNKNGHPNNALKALWK